MASSTSRRSLGTPASSSRLGPVVPLFRALSGRLKFTVRRHKFNEDAWRAIRPVVVGAHLQEREVLISYPLHHRDDLVDQPRAMGV